VTKADVADIFDGAAGILVAVTPEPDTWPQIHVAWEQFAAFVASKSPPPLSKADVRERSDPERAAAAHYLDTKIFADQAQQP